MAKRILVIGGLAAGPSAASKAVRTNADVEAVLFEQGEHISYGMCEVPYYISGEVQEKGLIAYTPASLKEKRGVDVRILHKVEEIDPGKKKIRIRDLKEGRTREESYDRLIVATGSRPRSIGVEGEHARNVFTVKSLDQGLQVKKYIEQEKPRRAVIIGGGYIGMEMADALRSLNLEVTILHRHSLPMAGLERGTREEVRERLEKHGVTFVAHAKTEGFVLGKNQTVTHVVTSNGSFEADLVIVSMGVVPNSEIAKNAGVSVGKRGGILTDQRQQTNLDHIYAAGDCCEVKNLVTNTWMYIPLATTASRAGWVAGENAAGGKAIFRGVVRAIAVRVFDLEVAQVGISADEAKGADLDPVLETITAWSRVGIMLGSKKVTITMITDRKSKRLLGANLFGEEGAVLRANTLAVAIQQKMTINEVQQLDLAYSPPFTPLWDPILVAANATARKIR